MLGWEGLALNGLACFEIGMIESCARDDSDSDLECKAYELARQSGLAVMLILLL